jgi:adenylate cyclase
MSAQTTKLAILFADICGSTALYEKLGDQLARQLIARCLAILNDTLIAHKGTLIKTIGDEILCTLPSADSAMITACEMQRAIKSDNLDSDHPMYIRVGFNYGDVICENGDIFGDAVNVAARVAAITRANQIMTTPAVIDLLPLALHDQVRKIQRVDIKGKQEQLDIYQVMWELEDMGSTRIGMSAYRKPHVDSNELILDYRTQSYTINEKNKKLLLGRDDICQIIVNSDFASRQHANVEFRFGKFILSDHSSNGTYIRSSDGVVTRLNREEVILHGKGTISLGQPYSDKPSDLIGYVIAAKTIS